MARYKNFDTSFWMADYPTSLSYLERYVYLYLQLNSHISLAGTCQLPRSLMLLETGLPVELLQPVLDKFIDDEMIAYRDGWLVVREVIKNQSNSPTIKKAIKTELATAPAWIGDWLEANGPEGDQRARHKAIIAVRELAEMFPPRSEWNDIIEVLGDDPDISKLTDCWLEWSDRGYSPLNWAWATDWYPGGIPSRNGKRSTADILSEYE